MKLGYFVICSCSGLLHVHRLLRICLRRNCNPLPAIADTSGYSVQHFYNQVLEYEACHLDQIQKPVLVNVIHNSFDIPFKSPDPALQQSSPYCLCNSCCVELLRHLKMQQKFRRHSTAHVQIVGTTDIGPLRWCSYRNTLFRSFTMPWTRCGLIRSEMQLHQNMNRSKPWFPNGSCTE